MEQTSLSGPLVTAANGVTAADLPNSRHTEGWQPTMSSLSATSFGQSTKDDTFVDLTSPDGSKLTTNIELSTESHDALTTSRSDVAGRMVSKPESSISVTSAAATLNHLQTTGAHITTPTDDSEHSTTDGDISLQPGHGNANDIADFFGQPFGIAVASAAFVALALVGGQVIWKLISTCKSGISQNAAGAWWRSGRASDSES